MKIEGNEQDPPEVFIDSDTEDNSDTPDTSYQEWGPEYTSALDTVNNLGVLYHQQGKMQEAEAMYQPTLEGLEIAWGSEHPSTQRMFNNLGILYVDQDTTQEAEAMFWRALDGRLCGSRQGEASEGPCFSGYEKLYDRDQAKINRCQGFVVVGKKSI